MLTQLLHEHSVMLATQWARECPAGIVDRYVHVPDL